MDVRRFLEQQDAASKNSRLACGPHGFIVGRDVRAAFFWLLFFAVQRKVTRAKRETLFCFEAKSKVQSKIKSTPPQSSPALRAREEAEANAGAKKQKSKTRSRSRSRWIPACAGMTAVLPRVF
jgi:hypothetical protein